MLVYKCKKRFFCSPLQRHIPVGAEVWKHEGTKKLIVKNAPFTDRASGITRSVFEFEGDKQVSWFYALESTAFFEMVQSCDDLEEKVEMKAVVGSSSLGMHLECLNTNERNALGAVKQGRVIFNKTRGNIEVFDGQVWLSQDLIKLKNKSGGDLTEGSPVMFSKDFPGSITTTDNSSNINVLGAVVDSGRNNGFLTVATSGAYRVRIEGSIKKGDFIVSSSTPGKGKSTGSKRIAAVFGVALQDGKDTLIKAFIFQG